MILDDERMNQLFRELRNDNIRKCVRKLLAGNDNCCFTTKQYKVSYATMNNIKNASGRLIPLADMVSMYDRVIGPQWGREHLTLPHMAFIREVNPDVWTYAGIPEEPI